MARKHRHEEHENHEAWAIPYGDLVTLLLAFFVVMYAISTLNEGKYRALSDSLAVAFSGVARSPDPIQVGDYMAKAKKGSPGVGGMVGTSGAILQNGNGETQIKLTNDGMSHMDQIVDQIESAMAEQIEDQTLRVRRVGSNVEIEIRTDALFPSGSASISPGSLPIMQTLADTLKTLHYAMRVEGHTDNRPISTALFPSNWELSAARAATVVHLFTQRGVDPSLMAVIGLGEFRPEEDNNTEMGRAANRRVRVIILSDGDQPELDQQIQTTNDDLNRQLTASTPVTTPTPVADTSAVASPVPAPATASSPVPTTGVATVTTAAAPATSPAALFKAPVMGAGASGNR